MENDVRKLTIEDLLNILADRFATGIPEGGWSGDGERVRQSLQELGRVAQEQGILDSKD